MRPAVLAAFVVLGSLLAVRCMTPAATLRVRMTIDLTTPTGLKSGSSVMQLTLARKFLIPLPGAGGSDYGGRYALYGEAPFIDLGDDAVLFTMRRGKSGDRTLMHAILDGTGVFERRNPRPSAGDEAILRSLGDLKRTATLSASNYPMFATVGDPVAWKSVTEIHPERLSSDLGPGYAIDRVIIQVVDKNTPLTKSLTARFPAVAKIGNLFVQAE